MIIKWQSRNITMHKFITPRVGSDKFRLQHRALFFVISIHAPRVGSDRSDQGRRRGLDPISIHAPRVGSDLTLPYLVMSVSPFQSTLPVWGATRSRIATNYSRQFQSTLPVWGATSYGRSFSSMYSSFQSTLPVWGATCQGCIRQDRQRPISIHAPRVGSDITLLNIAMAQNDFNPRSPCGERRGGAGNKWDTLFISIHAPRVGSDQRDWVVDQFRDLFQSTLPVWGATPAPEYQHPQVCISIHAPRVGSDSAYPCTDAP